MVDSYQNVVQESIFWWTPTPCSTVVRIVVSDPIYLKYCTHILGYIFINFVLVLISRKSTVLPPVGRDFPLDNSKMSERQTKTGNLEVF